MPIRYDYRPYTKSEKLIHKKVERFLLKCYRERRPVAILPQTRITKVRFDTQKRQIDVYLNGYFAYQPFREDNTTAIYAALRRALGWRFRQASLTIYCLNQPIEQLIPNYYRSDRQKLDTARLPRPAPAIAPLVRNFSKPYQPTKGLNGRNIALWHSHGWYYSQKMQRWEWQRPRLFQTVEDLLPTAFVLPYILPMLENAGGMAFLPRERDLQTHEVIVDNDHPTQDGFYCEIVNQPESVWQSGAQPGFGIGEPPYGIGENPFLAGTYRYAVVSSTPTAECNWTPEIPETGSYAVYIAYQRAANAVDDAHYTVFHSGGETEFLVNQQIGGATWIYLGTFHFNKGQNQSQGSVRLTNQSAQTGQIITADAVRFGGGMGNVERAGTISGRPRYTEAARYYLQYAGMPDTLIYSLNNENNDYNDDYQSRGEWVNYLRGAPYGPNKNRQHAGLGIPVDASIAFHTDDGRPVGYAGARRDRI